MSVSHFHDLLQCHKSQYPLEDKLLARMTRAPKFVFTQDVMAFIDEHVDVYADALVEARRAGHSELPHDPMVVEYEQPKDNHVFWLIEQDGAAKYRAFFAAIDRNATRVLPFSIEASLSDTGEMALDDAEFDYALPSPGVSPEAWKTSVDHIRGQTYVAMMFAMALHVRGIITKPAKPVSPKLDKARLKRRQPPITKDYVTVHIGFVTDQQGRRIAYREGLGHHVRVHLRRGHTRNQACGPGLEDHKQIWIPSVLVNYLPGATVADANYLVVP